MKDSVVYLGFLVSLAGCATGRLASPITITLQVTGPKAANDKVTRCEEIARQMGVTLAPSAPLKVALDMSDPNHLKITSCTDRVLYDQPRPAWMVAELCTDAIRKAAEVSPKTTARDLLNAIIGIPQFKVLLEGADQARLAFNMQADTAIDELDENSDAYAELVRVINSAQDAYRKFLSYGRNQAPPADLANIWADASCSPTASAGGVPIPGMNTVLRVGTGPDRTAIATIETERGLPILSFDAQMRATVTPEFRAYLIGDRIDVRGAIKRRVKRSKDATGPAEQAAHPGSTAPGGCSKDVDCKGNRICADGRCVSPSR